MSSRATRSVVTIAVPGHCSDLQRSTISDGLAETPFETPFLNFLTVNDLEKTHEKNL